MKKYYIYILSAILLMSCQKQSLEPDNIYAEAGLMSFSTQVKTKAPNITSLNEKTIGVYGFSFSNLTDWGTAKAKATPNEFLNQSVDVDASGNCSYSYDEFEGANTNVLADRKKWELNKKYAFFAYYPYSALKATSDLITPSELKTTIDGNEVDVWEVPYIDYTLPSPEGGVVDPASLYDILTAKVIDHNIVLGPVVGFNFYHRLFCIDVKAVNHDQEDVILSDLSMTISGIQYNKTRIYLDRDRVVYDEDQKKDISQSSIPSAETGWSGSLTFSPVIPDNSTITLKQGVVNQLTSGDNLIMLIPQDSSSQEMTISFSFIKNKTGDDTPFSTASSSYKIDFKEGNRYTLTLNFIGDKVQLVTASAKSWETDVNVDHIFD